MVETVQHEEECANFGCIDWNVSDRSCLCGSTAVSRPVYQNRSDCGASCAQETSAQIIEEASFVFSAEYLHFLFQFCCGMGSFVRSSMRERERCGASTSSGSFGTVDMMLVWKSRASPLADNSLPIHLTEQNDLERRWSTPHHDPKSTRESGLSWASFAPQKGARVHDVHREVL